ncbi:MAG: glycosyltransferase family 4 protein [Ferruginibacter sp.]|nr:glycosyltransferase family 4 protein [Ferruginibacter sp.]
MQGKQNSVLFFSLKIFSATGGIEKVCRVASKALFEIFNGNLQIFCMHDKTGDASGNKYFPEKIQRSFEGNKVKASFSAIIAGRKKEVIVLSHINLLPVGWVIKKLNPKAKLVLFTHGIEVWQPLNNRKRKMLHCCDMVFSVSNFTRQKLIDVQGACPAKCFVLNNCLDPFLESKTHLQKPVDLLAKYNLEQTDIIIMTLTRLAITERNKGYDKVIAAIASLQKKSAATIKYLIAGKYTGEEKNFIFKLAETNGVTVILTGFIDDKELPAYFALADMYIMPSKKEGFGITFIEAMYYGLPVIGGNADGSADALDNGKLGIMVNPDSVAEIESAIAKIIHTKTAYIPAKEKLMEKFGFDVYKENLKRLMHI